MAAITYTANARAPLITDSPAHTAGTQYSIDIKLRAFSTAIDQPSTQHVSLDGRTETILRRAVKVYNTVFIWPPGENLDVEEFLFSVAGGEEFTFDPFGTVAVPDNPINVVSVSGNALSIGVLQPFNETPWRSVSLTMRPIPA